MANGNAAIWGRSEELIGRDYQETGRPRQIHESVRLIDVREPSTRESETSRNFTAYVSARMIRAYTAGGGPGSPRSSQLLARLTTGVGGVQQVCDFRVPAVGKTIHVTADTIQLDVSLDESIRNQKWLLTAGCGVANLLPGETRIPRDFLVLEPPEPPVQPDIFQVAIPNFCERLKIIAGVPASLAVWEFTANLDTVLTIKPGSFYTNWQEIDIDAAYLLIESILTQRVMLCFERPS